MTWRLAVCSLLTIIGSACSDSGTGAGPGGNDSGFSSTDAATQDVADSITLDAPSMPGPEAASEASGMPDASAEADASEPSDSGPGAVRPTGGPRRPRGTPS